MMGLLDPVQTDLVIFTLSNGEKVFTNPHLVERKYYRTKESEGTVTDQQ